MTHITSQRFAELLNSLEPSNDAFVLRVDELVEQTPPSAEMPSTSFRNQTALFGKCSGKMWPIFSST